MTNSVTFSAAVGGDGSTVTDDSNASTGLANGGHRTRFVPALAQVVAVAANVVAKALQVAADAATATAQAATATAAAGTATAQAATATAAAGIATAKAADVAAYAAAIAVGPVASINGSGGSVVLKTINGASLTGEGAITISGAPDHLLMAQGVI